jgi:hypothetical protein
MDTAFNPSAGLVHVSGKVSGAQVFPEDLGKSFALGSPMVILKLILTGVHHFAN